MIALIISLLMTLGLVDSPEAYNDLSNSEQQELNSIVIEDISQD